MFSVMESNEASCNGGEMKITTIIFGFFLSISSFSSVGNSLRSDVPERFLPSPGARLNSESPIFIGMFGEVYSRRSNIGLVGKQIFGKNRPLKKDQFIHNLLDLGTPIPSEEIDSAYKNYVTHWVTEVIAPFYFRAVLNLEAKLVILIKSRIFDISFEKIFLSHFNLPEKRSKRYWE